MGISKDLLERVGTAQCVSASSRGVAMIMQFLNFVFTPVALLVKMINSYAYGVTRFAWLMELAIAVSALVLVFMTEVTNVPMSAFGVSELTARSLVFVSGISLILISVSAGLSYMLATDSDSAVANLFQGATFSKVYDDYLATFKHGIHSMLTVALTMMWTLDADRHVRWVGSDAADEDSTLTFVIILFFAVLVAKFLSEVKHGEDARAIVMENEVIGESVELKSGYRFKHARGAALTVSTGLLMYMLVNGDTSGGVLSFLGSHFLSLTLAIYILVVSLERIAGDSEWVIGGAGGLVITGIVSTLNLYAAGVALADDKSQEAVVLALGVIFLDAMRVGYGQPVPEKAIVSDSRKVLIRLLQALAGIVSFVFITKSQTDEQPATTALLFGVALASALLKIVGISYIGKDLFKTSTEHHYRELASTGLLLSSAYLWSHPLDENTGSAVAIAFFVIAILCRFLDSVLDFMMSGKSAIKYVSWDKEDEDININSPTSDNPRTWLTLLGLLVSLVFAAMVMKENFEHIQVHGDSVTEDGVEKERPLDKELSNSMIVAVTFISVHVAVVVLGFLSEICERIAVVALSRSKFVRFAVTTTVLSSLAVAAGSIGFTGADVSSDSDQMRIVSAIVAYMFADVVGRELL
jgi:hypothetical protein